MRQRIAWLAVASVLLIPVLIWRSQTGDLSIYFDEPVLTGQWAYVLSKLLGMLALTIMMLQLIITMLNNQRGQLVLNVRWLHPTTGLLIVVAMLAHVLSFFVAVSLRQDAWAWSLFLPDFKDFYHTHLTFGLFALLLVVMVAYAGVRRLQKPDSAFRVVHRLYGAVIVLVYIHALQVGSEAQSQTGFAFYVLLAVVAVVVVFGLPLVKGYFQCRVQSSQ